MRPTTFLLLLILLVQAFTLALLVKVSGLHWAGPSKPAVYYTLEEKR